MLQKFLRKLNRFWDDKIRQPWNRFTDTETMRKVIAFLKKVGIVLTMTGRWAYRLRSLVLSIPVFVCACALAIRNVSLLPELVGINILASGEYQWFISRGAAVMLPLALTAVCLLLMFCSKKILYPWLISVFSLAVPLVLWITNVFPA